jgi:hypothetical protein
MLAFWAIYSPVVATIGVLMAFARTGPEEARSTLSEWATFCGAKKVSKWLSDHSLDGRILYYGRPALLALLAVGGVALGYWMQPSSPSVVESAGTQKMPPSEDAIANQIHQLEYEKMTTLGRASFFNIMNGLSSLPPELKKPPKQFVIISSPPENVVLREDLNALFYLSWTQSRGALVNINLPDYEHDRDAPRFEADQSPGITIHGPRPLADFIERSLGNCFRIGTTTQMKPSSLLIVVGNF